MPRHKKVVDNTPVKVQRNVANTPDHISDMPTGLEDIVDNGTTTVVVNDIVKGTYPSLEVKEKIVEKVVIKEVIKEIEKPRLEGYELYAKLKELNYFQGGAMGFYMENPNGIEKVYVPHPQEVIAFFTGDPEKWEGMRDGIIRTYIELNETDNN